MSLKETRRGFTSPCLLETTRLSAHAIFTRTSSAFFLVNNCNLITGLNAQTYSQNLFSLSWLQIDSRGSGRSKF